MRTKHIVSALAMAGLVGAAGLASAEDRAKNDDSRYQKLEQRIEARLDRDRGLKAHDIDVDVHDGKVVLKGEVDSAAEKARAERIARRAGAKQLDNLLTVDGEANDGREGAVFDRRDGDNAAERVEERAEKTKDRVEERAEAAKDRIDEKAKADKRRVDDKAERTKDRLDRNVNDLENEVKRGDGDRPFDGR